MKKRQGGQELSAPALHREGKEAYYEVSRTAEDRKGDKRLPDYFVFFGKASGRGKIQSILSKAYDERVQNDLMDMIGLELPCR